ncbi:MAG: DNA primase, partial [Oscillospiraceae bacterium]|nr:DNA primase [Oscillospiraceae bacterium]
LPIMPHVLDSHPFAFNTRSGIVSLKNGKILPHERKYFITKIAGTEIADTAGCPVWERFLNDIFGGDADLIRYIQKAVGYSLTGSISEQCMFILLGDGHNGKSTFLEAIRGILGDYCSNMQAETIMMKSFGGGINSDIARLNKARMVTSSEPNEGVRLNEGLIKQITGGDAVTARKLFENEFEFRPEFKLWLAANHKPIVRGTDTGIWRRLHVIPFNVRIPPEKADKGLEGKLRKEYPAILKWAVEGCILWQTEGLEMPKAVLDMVKEYRREMDVISAFVEERCECGETLYARASALYAAYSEWCEKNNEYHMSNTKFAAEMSKRFTKVKRPDGLYYCGIKNI